MRLKNKLLLYTSTLLIWVAMCSVTFSAQSKIIDSLKNVVKAYPKQDDHRAKLLLEISKQMMAKDAKLALEYPEEILSFQNKIKDKNLVSGAYRIKGIGYFHLAKYPEALLALNKALDIAKTTKNSFAIGGALSNIGLVYMAQSKFPESLKYYLESLKIFASQNNELESARLRASIGIIYTEMGDYNRAMQYYQMALPVMKKRKDLEGESSLLANLGIINYKNKNIPEAIRYSKMSLELADTTSNLRGQARENGNLSAYYTELKQPDLALSYGLKAIEINHKTGNKKSLTINTINVSAAYLGLEKYPEAKSYAIQAIKAAEELDVIEIKRDASLNLSEVYNAMKMPDSALIYYKKYTQFAEAINNDKNRNEINRMEIQFDFDKKELAYQQKETLSAAQIQQQQLNLALNEAELQKGLQLRDLQSVQIQNEKLRIEEKEKQLVIAKNKEKLHSSQLKTLSQQQKLNQLELKQLWLYGILTVVVLASVLIYLLNLYRIRRLKYKNELQSQQAEKNELNLKHQYQLSESELKSIRSQMNPHFIFNVLNSIEAYVMDNEKRKAARLIQKFASLSRLILENSTKSLVTADKEWKALMLYTELEAMRYDDIFTYNFFVKDDIDLKTLYLPPMLVQPLIENAILHGLIIDPKPDANLIVTIKKKDDGICITVEDNGVGIKNTMPKNQNRTGIKELSMGLVSINERIDMINKQQSNKNADFTITSYADKTGTIAVINLPYFDNLSGNNFI